MEKLHRQPSLRQALHLSVKERFTAFTLRLMGGPARRLSRTMPQLRDEILKSNLSTTPESLLSITLFFVIIAVAIASIGAYLLIVHKILLAATSFLGVPLSFLIGINAPKISQSARSGALNEELPYVIGYISVLAGGGISPIVTLRRLSKVDLFPAAAKEAMRILMDIDIRGMDPLSALDKAAKFNPNKVFSEFISGYTGVLRIGGDAVSYLENKLKDVFAFRTIKLKRAAETIGTFAEAYITATVVLGISFFILFAVQNLVPGGGGGGGLDQVILFSAVFVPLISIGFIYLLHLIQGKEPFTYNKPYRAFLLASPAIPAAIFVPLPLDLVFYVRLSIGLLISVIPAAIYNSRESRHRRSIETRLPQFLRDISEVKKTGLAPEKAIEQLSGRNYGSLTRHVRSISSQLSWGIPMAKVMTSFAKSVTSWIAKIVAFLLLEVVEVGGGTVKMFVTLADFTEKTAETDHEKRSMLRPYIFVPYFGAVMVVMTTAMMLFFLAAPISTGPSPFSTAVNLKQATTTLLSGSIFQSWVMGLVAGKMGEGSLASGFKHAAALVVISLVSVYVATTIMGISL